MPTAEQFLQDLDTPSRSPDVLPVFGVIGEEDFYRREVLDGVLRLLGARFGELDVVRLDGDSTDAASVLDDLRSKTLFGGRRVVVLRDAGGRKSLVDAERDKLEDYVEKPASHSTFVLVLDKLNRSLRLAKALDKQKARIDCDPPKNADALVRWLMRRAKQVHALELPADVAQHVIACCGPAMSTLVQELDKLDLWLGKGSGRARVASMADVDEALGFRGSTSAFALLDQLVAGQLAPALNTAGILLRQGEHPYKLTALVSSRLRQLWKAAGYVAEGLSHREAVSAAKVPPFLAAEFAATLRSFDLDTCRAIHDELMRADHKLNPLDAEREFELFVMRVCKRLSAARKSPARA